MSRRRLGWPRTAFLWLPIVHDDMSGEGGNQHLLDIDAEPLAIDRAVDQPGGVDAIAAQGGQESHGFPMAVRDFGSQPHPPWRPAPKRCHVGLGPGFIEEDQATGIDPALIPMPLSAPSRDVRTILLAGHQRFF
jgi:hypothetical protein